MVMGCGNYVFKIFSCKQYVLRIISVLRNHSCKYSASIIESNNYIPCVSVKLLCFLVRKSFELPLILLLLLLLLLYEVVWADLFQTGSS